MNVADPAPEHPEAAPCASPSVMLATLGRWAGKQFADALNPLGIKKRHLGTLLELRTAPLAQQALGDALGVDAAQLVGLLNELEAEQLVQRRRDPADRRRHIVEISELGRARLAIADRAIARVDAKLMNGLTSEQQTAFAALLRFVVEHGGYDAEDRRTPACLEESDACT